MKGKIIPGVRYMKKVLLLGDSIRLGYQTLVGEKLGGRAEVVGPEDNCRFTKYTLWYVNHWVNELGKPDIIHWNNGLWDVYRHNDHVGIFTPLEEYLCELKRILAELRKTDAKIIWASTTPVSLNHQYCRNSDIDLYNKAAEKLMNTENIEINDLNSRVKEKLQLFICEDYIHLSDQGKESCAEAVAAVMNKYL